MIKIYLSGPISGLPYSEVQTAFNAAADLARKAGKTFYSGQPIAVVSPLDNGLPVEAPYNDHLAADIAMLLDCDAVLMLRGWHTSKGARSEHFIAHTYGKRIVYITE